MKRRNFLAMASSVFLAPFAFLRDKPTEVASGLSGCPVGPKGEQGQPGFLVHLLATSQEGAAQTHARAYVLDAHDRG